MYCSNCKNKVDDNDKYCNSCGKRLLNVAPIDESFIEEDTTIKRQEFKTNIDSDEVDVFIEKIISFFKYVKEVIARHKILFGLSVAVFIVICYTVFWSNTLNEAKTLASQGEFVKAKDKVEILFNPFRNQEIEKIIYLGNVYWPKEAIENLEKNPNNENVSYYRTILENLFEGIRRLQETDLPQNTDTSALYTYYFLKVNDYVDDVYTVDVHNLMHMSEEEQQKHITQIAKNIIAQNKIDTIERNVESKLELEKIKFFHSYSYDNNELVCNCYLKVDKNAKHKNYKDFKIFVTYYDENYNEIYSDSYELDQVYRGYGKEIQIISFPETKIKPFKSSVFVDYSYAY